MWWRPHTHAGQSKAGIKVNQGWSYHRRRRRANHDSGGRRTLVLVVALV